MKNIKVIKGDITKMHVDVIVNAANPGLRGGGGVDGATPRAGGTVIMQECKKIGRCPTGKAVITTGGDLPAKFVIHAVGPVWRGGDEREEELLKNAYINSLKLAEKSKAKSIAFPNISTGVYGFPKKRAAKIAIESTKTFLESASDRIEVTFVCFDDENYHLYEALIP